MGYLKIQNLERNQTILEHRACWALEKVHGTSAHIKYNAEHEAIHYFHGGVSKAESFRALFDHEELLRRFGILVGELDVSSSITLYGEAYGGKMQGMSSLYGPNLGFIGFDVRIDDHYWLDVPNAFNVATQLGQHFVPFSEVGTGIESLEAVRDAPSRIWPDRLDKAAKGEGVVLRPLTECVDYRGNRVISKYKADWAKERKSTKVINPGQKEMQLKSRAFAEEFVVHERLLHILDAMSLHPKFHTLKMDRLGDVIAAMQDDVLLEEGVELKEGERQRALRAIASCTVRLYKEAARSQMEAGK